MVGIGRGNVTYKNADTDRDLFEFTGYITPVGVQFGSRVSKNLGIFVNFKLCNFPIPKLTNYSTFSMELADVSINTFGGGLAFYFGKGNNYFSPAILYSRTGYSFRTPGDIYMPTKGGLGLDLVVGSDKNLWGKMAFGIAFVLHISSMTDQKSVQFGEPKVFCVFYGFEMSLKFGK